jgi:Protein of unknown function (DUF3533)
MLALGLATEVAITVLTTRFVAFFLIPFIVVNVSVTVVPNDIQPWVRICLYFWGTILTSFTVLQVRTWVPGCKRE